MPHLDFFPSLAFQICLPYLHGSGPTLELESQGLEGPLGDYLVQSVGFLLHGHSQCVHHWFGYQMLSVQSLYYTSYFPCTPFLQPTQIMTVVGRDSSETITHLQAAF